MSCQTLREELIDLARHQVMDASQRQAALFHLEQCRSCAAWFSSQQLLTEGLQVLARSTAAQVASEKLEENLLQAFRQQPRSKSGGEDRPRRASWLVAGAAAAALLFFLFAGEPLFVRLPPSGNTAQHQPKPVAGGAEASPSIAPQLDRAELPAGTPAPIRRVEAEQRYFLLLDHDDPIEMGLILRVSLPASILSPTGGDLEQNPAGEISAEVLLGEDGLARGIRLLPETY